MTLHNLYRVRGHVPIGCPIHCKNPTYCKNLRETNLHHKTLEPNFFFSSWGSLLYSLNHVLCSSPHSHRKGASLITYLCYKQTITSRMRGSKLGRNGEPVPSLFLWWTKLHDARGCNSLFLPARTNTYRHTHKPEQTHTYTHTHTHKLEQTHTYTDTSTQDRTTHAYKPE